MNAAVRSEGDRRQVNQLVSASGQNEVAQLLVDSRDAPLTSSGHSRKRSRDENDTEPEEQPVAKYRKRYGEELTCPM
jgi:hypothetical protein